MKKYFIFYLILSFTKINGQSLKLKLQPGFISGDYKYIKLYRFNAANSCDQSKAVSIIYENKISKCFDFVKILNAKTSIELIRCLKNGKTYGKPSNSCFDVDYALVMYDSKNIITGFVNISFYCHILDAMPHIQTDAVRNNRLINGFSHSGQEKIIRLLGINKSNLYPSQIISSK